MRWKLFIDDERLPLTPDWMIAKSSYEAQRFVEMWGVPFDMALDHDLSGQDTSVVFIHWLMQYMEDNDITLPDDFTYSIHSQNPVGRDNINGYMYILIKKFGE